MGPLSIFPKFTIYQRSSVFPLPSCIFRSIFLTITFSGRHIFSVRGFTLFYADLVFFFFFYSSSPSILPAPPPHTHYCGDFSPIAVDVNDVSVSRRKVFRFPLSCIGRIAYRVYLLLRTISFRTKRWRLTPVKTHDYSTGRAVSNSILAGVPRVSTLGVPLNLVIR